MKKKEFSKLWLIACIGISLIYTTASYILAIFDKQTLEGLSGIIVETLWGASGVSFIGYALQNSVRAYTSSKFGIPKNGGESNGTETDSSVDNWTDNSGGNSSISDYQPEVKSYRVAQIRCIRSGKNARRKDGSTEAETGL